MKNQKTIALALTILMSACQQTESPTQSSPETASEITKASEKTSSALATNHVVVSQNQLETIVKEVMNGQYGRQYDRKHDCWPYSSGDAAYCMKPSAAKLIETKNGKAIYFYAANRSDINDDPRYGYSHAESGLMGAFKLSIDSLGSWKYSATSKAMDFGSAGYCGCDKAEFVKLGNDDYYGWVFASGGVWQGMVVSNHEIIAPKDSVFKNLSSIPEIREEEQDTRYQIKIIDSITDSIFPISVKKIKAGVATEERTISFDQEKWMYSLPKDF